MNSQFEGPLVNAFEADIEGVVKQALIENVMVCL